MSTRDYQVTLHDSTLNTNRRVSGIDAKEAVARAPARFMITTSAADAVVTGIKAMRPPGSYPDGIIIDES